MSAMRLFVQYCGNAAAEGGQAKYFPVDVKESEDSVAAVKEQAASHLGVSPTTVVLAHRGRVLANDSCLSSLADLSPPPTTVQLLQARPIAQVKEPKVGACVCGRGKGPVSLTPGLPPLELIMEHNVDAVHLLLMMFRVSRIDMEISKFFCCPACADDDLNNIFLAFRQKVMKLTQATYCADIFQDLCERRHTEIRDGIHAYLDGLLARTESPVQIKSVPISLSHARELCCWETFLLFPSFRNATRDDDEGTITRVRISDEFISQAIANATAQAFPQNVPGSGTATVPEASSGPGEQQPATSSAQATTAATAAAPPSQSVGAMVRTTASSNQRDGMPSGARSSRQPVPTATSASSTSGLSLVMPSPADSATAASTSPRPMVPQSPTNPISANMMQEALQQVLSGQRPGQSQQAGTAGQRPLPAIPSAAPTASASSSSSSSASSSSSSSARPSRSGPVPAQRSSRSASQQRQMQSLQSQRAHYAEQLTMMQVMGMQNERHNLQALIATEGDVNAASDLVLSGAFS